MSSRDNYDKVIRQLTFNALKPSTISRMVVSIKSPFHDEPQLMVVKGCFWSDAQRNRIAIELASNDITCSGDFLLTEIIEETYINSKEVFIKVFYDYYIDNIGMYYDVDFLIDNHDDVWDERGVYIDKYLDLRMTGEGDMEQKSKSEMLMPIMEKLDELKHTMSENAYLEMCNTIRDAYK